MRVLLLALAAPCLCAAALLAGDAATPPAPPPPEVSVVTLKPRTVPITTELNARVTPFLVAEVRPQVDGIIRERIFAEGAAIKKNDQLYLIDPAVYQAQLDAAKAGVDKADAAAGLAEVEADRYKVMSEKGAATKENYDQAAAAYRKALADIELAKAQLNLAQVNLNYTKVFAPIEGRIGKSSVTVGALVAANQSQALATIQQLDPVYIDIAQATRDFTVFRHSLNNKRMTNTGKNYGAVRIRLEDGSLYAHEGKLAFADVSVDQSTSSILLRASVENPDHTLLPGMYVRVFLDLDHVEDALVVPQQSVNRQPDGMAFLLVVGPDGTAERRRVVPGRTVGSEWIIDSGLKAGERVVVEGGQRVRFLPNAPAPKVNAVEWTPPAAKGKPDSAAPENGGKPASVPAADGKGARPAEPSAGGR